jgi:hypothetical protein
MLDAMHSSPPPPPDEAADAVVLYSRPGCHLCDEALAALMALLAERAASGRPAPAIVERDITSDPGWEREFLATIPVVEVAGQRLELATSPMRIRAFLDLALDRAGAPPPSASPKLPDAAVAPKGPRP